ncbi:LLM class flavin-dependent oxidoreductase [Ktedonospora formicarum]|uniref:Luciferase n=1 Tax=Ktedonospora formicarum TaxID=2778364 RepID=A0A8J3HWR1_9CHLR|nr:LLM class flavin-dependent oxidoreductase [Ktedonospora formicarum]GHO42018.1 luciferase [Ktedonospora formicarum]
MELGFYTFADVMTSPVSGEKISPAQRLRNLIEEIELADQVGLDVFGLGEHHRPEYVVSAPAVALAAAAECTRNIRLTSAVTVLSSDDPVRVFQNFATLDLLSGGRAEIMAGRGSFIESFPLFGYDLDDYDQLFSEKLDLLLHLREEEHVTWSGKHRPSIRDRGIYPRPLQNPLPIWIAVGGTPASVMRAGTLGLPMALAIIGGQTPRFVPLAKAYREAATRAGHDATTLPISINSHGYIADTSQQARDEHAPYHLAVMNELGKERGWRPMSRSAYDAETSQRGALMVGSPEEVIDKILYQHSLFGHQRFLMQASIGAMPHKNILHAIELLGTKIAPVIRRETRSSSDSNESLVDTRP